MAIEKQIIEIPLDMGLDTKTDDKKLSNGALSVAENVVYETLKSLKKRNGYEKILTKDLNSVSIQNIKRLAKFKRELLSLTQDKLYSYSSLQTKWVEKGALYGVYPTSKAVIKNYSEQTSPTFAYVEGFKCYAYENSDGKIYYSVIDSSSDTFVVSFDEVATGTNPKITYTNNLVFVFYRNGTDLKYKTFSVANPTNLSTETTTATDYESTDDMYDVETGDSKVYVAYNSSDGASPLKIYTILEDGTKTSVVGFSGEDASDAIDLRQGSATQYILSYADGTDVKSIITGDAVTNVILNPTSVETIGSVTNVTAVLSAPSTYTLYYEVSAAASFNHFIKSSTLTVAGAATNNGVYKRSVGLAAKAFIKNNIIFVPVLHSSALQATNFLLDANGSLVSKWNGGEAGSLTQMGGLPKPFEVDTDVVEVTTTRKGVFTADNGDFDSLLGVYTTALDFEETSLYRNSSLADNLHIAGGVLQMYDGDNVAEHGFQIYPETLTSNIPAAGAGSMSDGTYDYVAVYAWTDNFGNIHRSAPSPSVEVELTAGTADQSVEILVPTLRLTQKTNVIIELYRTENNGTLFYKVTDTTTPTANDSTVDTVTITDTIADTSGGSPVLATREALYTTGGVLENIAADGARLITRYKNRIILAGQEDNVLQYSKIALEGAPVEFNDTLTLKIPSDGQTETAIIEMDEKLIIFKESAIYYIAGDGPNNLGEQDNFTEPELISSDIGCSEADSVVLTPLGVMFKSLKGIYVLSNSLNLTYVGDRVEGYNDLTIKSANVVGELNQVRFVTSGDLTLVYNYHLDKWATFTNHGGTSSVVIGNDYYYLRNDESVFKENRTVFSDNGAPIKMRVVTGWLYLGDIQGFQRIYKTLVLGSYKSNHKVKIRVAYDFVNIFKHEKVFDITDFINVNKYGEESPYGEPTTSYYGSSNDTSGNRYQYRVDMKQQKCQSVKLWIEDMQSATVGEGLTISGITFQVGMKGGPFRIESNRQYGTS